MLEDTEEDVNAQHWKTWHTFELLIRSGGIFIMTPTIGFNKVKGVGGVLPDVILESTSPLLFFSKEYFYFPPVDRDVMQLNGSVARSEPGGDARACRRKSGRALQT